VYRTKLARTLLVLGIGASCQRADDLAQSRRPLVDREARPAVGNIGQTGAPARAEIAHPPTRGTTAPQVGATAPLLGATAPLESTNGSPAVGNIGQTGRPTTRTRPVPRRIAVTVPRVKHAPRPVVQEIQTEAALEPLVREDRRPAVGNTPTKGKPRRHAREDVVGEQPVQERIQTGEDVRAIQPLVRDDGRPAVGNTPSKKGGD
jgi:hypothetical protein